jgi:nucleotide-binding universal stress UspA family protein
MATTVCGRVVVGVDDSPAGLRTLRAAVSQARQRHQELVAVRAFRLPRDPEAQRSVRLAWVLAGPGEPAVPAREWLHEVALRQRHAMHPDRCGVRAGHGEIPDAIPVRVRLSSGPPGPLPVGAACHEMDLLVVGISASHRWWPFRRPVGRYCAAHATCPVLLVPPPELAREAGGRHRPWRRRELDRLLTAGLR